MLLCRYFSAEASPIICELISRPLLLLARNSSSGEFRVVEQLSANTTKFEDGQTRFLRDNEVKNVRRNLRFYDVWDNHQHGELFYARECNCFEPQFDSVFCPLAVSMCQVVSSSSGNKTSIECVSDWETAQVKIQCAFWFAALLFFLLFFALLCSTFGRDVLDHLITGFFPSWNTFVVNRMLRRGTDRMHELLDAHFSRRRSNRGEQDNPTTQQEQKPTSLLLKTQTFDAEKRDEVTDSSTTSDESSEKDGEATCCSICFEPLKVGDKVGALSCIHIFRKSGSNKKLDSLPSIGNRGQLTYFSLLCFPLDARCELSQRMGTTS
jgi:hypothetical protein